MSGFPAIINHIDSIVDKFGRIRDNASAELFAIRRTIREREGQASRRLLQIMGAAQASGLVDADASVSVRDGRAVIPVSAANKRKIKGARPRRVGYRQDGLHRAGRGRRDQ